MIFQNSLLYLLVTIESEKNGELILGQDSWPIKRHDLHEREAKLIQLLFSFFYLLSWHSCCASWVLGFPWERVSELD